MRHVWGLATALGLLLFVVFGTLACLSAGANEPTSTSVVVAIAGALLMAVGIIGRRGGSEAVAKARAVLGALGLVVASVTGFLTVMALFIDPSSVVRFLLITIAAAVAWAQGVALQIGLSIRMSLVWLLTLLAFSVVVIVIGAIGTSILVGWLGMEPGLGTRLVFAVVLALTGLLVWVWSRGRPDRRGVFSAVAGAALGRRETGDLELLAAGPVPILRGRMIIPPARSRIDAPAPDRSPDEPGPDGTDASATP